MTYPEDVLKAAREAAARYWDALDAADSGEGYDENARLCRSGECDADPEVQSACIAIMAEREKVAALVEAAMEARRIAMEQTVAARVPECGKFGDIAQDLDAALAAFGKEEE
ncbi:hypothetical protein [Pedomonas sp. V897]|uniref:hypothetical protein n=1 Tax=Pedomonas sp. V897 TaxID=3446482 RepID=UPI003EE3971E